MTDSRDTVGQNQLFSIAASLPVRLIRLTADGRLPCATWVEADITRIGGGDVMVVAAEEFAVGDLVCMSFLIPDTDEEMRLYARVVEVSGTGETTDLRTVFIGISERERGALLRYAYRQQIRAAMEVRA
jgi:Tfp pilus assembly protein PilZ